MLSSTAARTKSFLEDNLWRLMVRLSLPGIVGMGVISLGSLIDAIFVGQYIGSEAVAGISLVFPLTILNNSVAGLISAGSASLYSRALGAKNSDVIEKIFGNLLFLSLILSALLTGISLIFSEELIQLMGGSGEVLRHGAEYYQSLMVGVFFSIFALSSGSLVRAEGSVKTAMLFVGIAVGINLILSPIFINYYNLGIRGAALGTVLSMVVYSVFNVIYFLSGKSAIPKTSIKVRLNQVYIQEILSVGFSAFLMQAVNFVRQTFIFRSMAYYGDANDLAFLGATVRVFMVAILPIFGILQALQPVVGINYGARLFGRSISAVRIFRTGANILLVILLLPCILLPELVLSLILPDYNYSANEIFNFRLVMLVLPFIPFASTGIVFFQAVGQGRIASRLSISREVIFVPAIIFLPILWGVDGIYFSMFIENVLYIAIAYAITKRSFKKVTLEETKNSFL